MPAITNPPPDARPVSFAAAVVSSARPAPTPTSFLANTSLTSTSIASYPTSSVHGIASRAGDSEENDWPTLAQAATMRTTRRGTRLAPSSTEIETGRTDADLSPLTSTIDEQAVPTLEPFHPLPPSPLLAVPVAIEPLPSFASPLSPRPSPLPSSPPHPLRTRREPYSFQTDIDIIQGRDLPPSRQPASSQSSPSSPTLQHIHTSISPDPTIQRLNAPSLSSLSTPSFAPPILSSVSSLLASFSPSSDIPPLPTDPSSSPSVSSSSDPSSLPAHGLSPLAHHLRSRRLTQTLARLDLIRRLLRLLIQWEGLRPSFRVLSALDHVSDRQVGSAVGEEAVEATRAGATGSEEQGLESRLADLRRLASRTDELIVGIELGRGEMSASAAEARLDWAEDGGEEEGDQTSMLSHSLLTGQVSMLRRRGAIHRQALQQSRFPNLAPAVLSTNPYNAPVSPNTTSLTRPPPTSLASVTATETSTSTRGARPLSSTEILDQILSETAVPSASLPTTVSSASTLDTAAAPPDLVPYHLYCGSPPEASLSPSRGVTSLKPYHPSRLAKHHARLNPSYIPPCFSCSSSTSLPLNVVNGCGALLTVDPSRPILLPPQPSSLNSRPQDPRISTIYVGLGTLAGRIVSSARGRTGLDGSGSGSDGGLEEELGLPLSSSRRAHSCLNCGLVLGLSTPGPSELLSKDQSTCIKFSPHRTTLVAASSSLPDSSDDIASHLSPGMGSSIASGEVRPQLNEGVRGRLVGR